MDDRNIGERIQLAATRPHPELARVVGSYRWDVEGAGSWFLAVDHGAVTVREDRAEADCVIGSDEPDFWAIVEGRQNLITAMMQGRVSIQGDLALAQKLHGLLPGPAGAASARGG